MFETIYFETLIPSRGVRSPIGPVSKIRYISHWPLMDHRMDRLQSGTLCTDDDILIELIFIYFPETLGFWKCQSHRKPLSVRGNPLSLEIIIRSLKSADSRIIDSQTRIPSRSCSCSYKGSFHHQKDAHPKGIRIPGFQSYVSVYKLTQENVCCLRLQPHLYPSMVVTGLGRGDELRHSRRE